MKKVLALVLTGAMMMTMAVGCTEQKEPVKETGSYEKVNNEVINVTPTDVFGEHSIVVLGDSIAHGSTVGDIVNDSWVGILKKAINERSGDNNHGFTSVEGTLWSKPLSYEMHKFPETPEGFRDRSASGTGWAEYRTAELLGTKGLGSGKKDATLTFTPQERFQYFCVYYQAGPDYGTFDVCDSDGNVLGSFDAKADEANYARTEMLDMSVLPEDNKIVLKATSEDEIIFTGIGYYNDPDGVVVSNYSNGGLQFAGTGKSSNGDMTGLDNKFIDLATSAGTVIFSLGYNDAHFTSDHDLFAEKIDYMIKKAKENGTKIIVSDTCWDFTSTDKIYLARYPHVKTVKAQLKRLAEETGGVYVDQQAENGQALLDTIADGAHPNAEGHAMMAATLLKAMGLAEAETDE